MDLDFYVVPENEFYFFLSAVKYIFRVLTWQFLKGTKNSEEFTGGG